MRHSSVPACIYRHTNHADSGQQKHRLRDADRQPRRAMEHPPRPRRFFCAWHDDEHGGDLRRVPEQVNVITLNILMGASRTASLPCAAGYERDRAERAGRHRLGRRLRRVDSGHGAGCRYRCVRSAIGIGAMRRRRADSVRAERLDVRLPVDDPSGA